MLIQFSELKLFLVNLRQDNAPGPVRAATQPCWLDLYNFALTDFASRFNYLDL